MDDNNRREDIKDQLIKRGYSKGTKNQLKKVDMLKRENLLQYNTKKQNNRVPLVLTYSKALPDIHTILRKNMKTLYKSERMKNVFKRTSDCFI